MNIAFEISPLITASGTFGDKSGVYRYTYGLLSGLIENQKKKNLKNKIYLFTFANSLLFYSINPEILKLVDNKGVFLIGYDNKLTINRKSESRWSDWMEIIGVPIIRYPLKILDNFFSFRKMYKKYREIETFNTYAKQLKNEFKKNHVSIVYHSETSFYPMESMKNVITVYDLTTVFLPNFHRTETCDLQSRKLRFAKKYCQGVVTISESTKNDLLTFSPQFKKKKILVGYPGVDESFTNESDELSLNDINAFLLSKGKNIEKDKYFLFYSTFEPRKNILYLVRAFADLYEEKKIPSSFKMVLIGGKGWGKVKMLVDNFIQENFPIDKKNPFILLEYMSDNYIRVFIKNAYAVVYPSIYEGFGLPVLESQVLGTPVLCSNTSSLPEVAGNAALYVNPKDYQDLKEKMKHIIDHPELAEYLSKKGRKQSKKFTWDKTAQNVLNFLETL